MPAPKEKQVYYSIKINGVFLDVTGRKRTPSGYIALCIKEHPYSDVQGYIFEHRVMMEKEIGRYLKPNEVVHHKNEIKHDNRLENLELMTHGEHTTLHNTGRKHDEKTKEKMSLAAKRRFSRRENHPNYKSVDEEIKQMILEGKKPTEISKKLSIARKTVYNKIEYLGLKEMYKNVK